MTPTRKLMAELRKYLREKERIGLIRKWTVRDKLIILSNSGDGYKRLIGIVDVWSSRKVWEQIICPEIIKIHTEFGATYEINIKSFDKEQETAVVDWYERQERNEYSTSKKADRDH